MLVIDHGDESDGPRVDDEFSSASVPSARRKGSSASSILDPR